MGRGGIQKFNDFRSAIAKRDWKVASNELADSRWAKQTGRRAKDYIQFFKNLT